MHTIRICRSKNIEILQKEEETMKKLIISLLLVILLVAGCTTPEPTTKPPVVQQPTEQVVVSTTKPTTEPTVVPTEVPTEKVPPTEIPTEVVEQPTFCPSEEEIQVASPEDLVIVLDGDGDGTRIKATEANDGQRSFYLLNMKVPAKLYEEGGEFSFTMPSAGFVFLGKNTTCNGESSIARSPSGELVIPKGMTLEIQTEGGFTFPENVLQIVFISGQTLPMPTLPDLEGISISCNKQLWEISVVNTTEKEVEFPILGKLQYLIKDPDGVAKLKTSRGEIPGTDIQTGFILSEGDKITLLPNGGISFVLWDFYPVK